jgi:hypothetical protein
MAKELFVALEIWRSSWLVKDELWRKDLIEGIDVPCAENILDEFVEALNEGLVLFRRHILLCPPSLPSPDVAPFPHDATEHSPVRHS